MASAAGVKAGKAFVAIEALDKTGMVLKRLDRKMANFASRMSTIGRQAVMAATVAALPIALSTKTFATFDDSMRKVEARSAGTAEEMAALRQQAKLLGRTTSFTASQVGELQAKLAQKGFDRRQIKDTTASVLNLARAAGSGDASDTILAADMLGAATAQFSELGRTQADTARISDVFTAAVNNSNLSLETLQEGMRKAAPIADQYNLSFEDTVALLGTLGNVAIEGSEAGTSLKNVFLNASKNSDKFNAALKKATGQTITFVDESGNLRDAPDLLFEIGAATRALGTAERGKLLEMLFGKRAIGPAAALGKAADDFGKLRDVLVASGRTAEKTAKQMDAGLGGSFRRILSAAEGVQIAVGESLDAAFTVAGDSLARLLEKLAAWIERNQHVVAITTAAIAAVAAFGVTMLSLALVVKLASVALGLFATTLAVVQALIWILTSPIGLAVLAVAALTAALFVLSSTARNVAAGLLSRLGGAVRELSAIFNKTWMGITAALRSGDLEGAMEIAGLGLKAAWASVVKEIKDIWIDLVAWGGKRWLDLAVGLEKTMNDAIAAVKLKVIDLYISWLKMQEKVFGKSKKWKIFGAEMTRFGPNAERDKANRGADARRAMQEAAVDIAAALVKDKNAQDLAEAMRALEEAVQRQIDAANRQQFGVAPGTEFLPLARFLQGRQQKGDGGPGIGTPAAAMPALAALEKGTLEAFKAAQEARFPEADKLVTIAEAQDDKLATIATALRDGLITVEEVG